MPDYYYSLALVCNISCVFYEARKKCVCSSTVHFQSFRVDFEVQLSADRYLINSMVTSSPGYHSLIARF